MKKTLFAGLLLATLSTGSMSAKTLSVEKPETTQCFTYRTCYVTETVGGCKVTYRVTTKYFLCCVISSTKCEVSRDCTGGGGQGGGNFAK